MSDLVLLVLEMEVPMGLQIRVKHIDRATCRYLF